MRNLSLSLLFSLAAMSACKHESTSPDGLPEAYRGGPNVMACYVNGQKWVAQQGQGNLTDPGSPAVDGGITGDDKRPYLWLYGGSHDNLVLYASPMLDTGTVAFDQTACPLPQCLRGPDYASFGNYFTSNTATGKMHVSFVDTVANEILGTFAFRAKNASGDTVNITDGRFYYKYKYRP